MECDCASTRASCASGRAAPPASASGRAAWEPAAPCAGWRPGPAGELLSWAVEGGSELPGLVVGHAEYALSVQDIGGIVGGLVKLARELNVVPVQLAQPHEDQADGEVQHAAGEEQRRVARAHRWFGRGEPADRQQGGRDQQTVEIEQANEQPMQGPDGQPVIGMDGQPVMVISGRIKSTEKKTIVKVEAFSCHEMLVERDWTSPLLEDCPYVCRLMRVTVSDLHNMGFKDVTASDMRDDEDSPMRLRTADRPGDEYAAPTEEADDSTTEGTLRIEYILADDDLSLIQI